MIAVFVAAIPVSNIVGSLISGLLLNLDGWLGLAGWQWLFILEAAPAVVLGIVFYLYMTDRPQHALGAGLTARPVALVGVGPRRWFPDGRAGASSRPWRGWPARAASRRAAPRTFSASNGHCATGPSAPAASVCTTHAASASPCWRLSRRTGRGDLAGAGKRSLIALL